MRQHYPHKTMAELQAILGKSVSAIYNRSNTLGLKKAQEYLDSPAASRLRPGANSGGAYRFKKGFKPSNAGMKGWQADGVQPTQFKKGNKPQTWQPIGTEKLDKDGMLLVKVSDDPVRAKRWRPKHALLWERLNGREIPKGHLVVMRDRSKTNFYPQNLELVSRAENMRRNSYHNNYPKEVQLAIQLMGALQRQINKRANHEQH